VSPGAGASKPTASQKTPARVPHAAHRGAGRSHRNLPATARCRVRRWPAGRGAFASGISHAAAQDAPMRSGPCLALASLAVALAYLADG
jgi:hypothetical protein